MSNVILLGSLIFIIFKHPVALWHHFYIFKIPSIMQEEEEEEQQQQQKQQQQHF
jgi:hypothetical protein